jgi:uncharacterized membrane protein YkvA (DUF1232 family)
LKLSLQKRAKLIAEPYIAQYGRVPGWVKIATWVLIAMMLLPDPFDWVPGLGLLDEILYASILLGLLYKYGALPGEKKLSAKELVNDIFNKDRDKDES